ncbi:hypothetical protein ACWC5I_40775 [Kitasatospora sp. NPDC001574]
MGLRSFLGFGSSDSGSSGTPTRTSGMSTTGWHPAEAQVSLPSPGTDSWGRRAVTPDPYSRPDSSSSTRRNFGRPYSDGGV